MAQHTDPTIEALTARADAIKARRQALDALRKAQEALALAEGIGLGVAFRPGLGSVRGPNTFQSAGNSMIGVLDQLTARIVAVEAAVASLSPVPRISDTAAGAGDAAYLKPGGHVALATGSRRASYVYGATVGIGGMVVVYPSGSRCPVAKPVGDLYRQPDGSINNMSPASGDDTQFMGVSDGTEIAVNILDEVLAP